MPSLVLTVGSLFSGIGAMDLGLERAGFKVLWQVEIDEWCCGRLEEQWPGLRRYRDICSLRGDELESVDLLAGGPPCFAGETLVMTEQGYKAIKDIRPGDAVLTHKGRYRPVLVVMERPLVPTVAIHAQGVAEPIVTTPDHPFYARTSRRRSTRIGGGKRRSWTELSGPHWVAARDLRSGMYLGFPLDPSNGDDLFTEGFWYLVGRYLGDGWLVTSKRAGRITSRKWEVAICCNKAAPEDLAEAIRRTGFRHHQTETRTTARFTISSQFLTTFLTGFGRYAHGKHLIPSCFALPQVKKQALFNGWLAADGYVDATGLRCVTTVSRQLAYDMARIARSAFERPVSISRGQVAPCTKIEGRTVNQRTQYRVRVAPNNRYGFVEGNHLWACFKGSTPSTPTTVYNLEVSEDNSYTADGLSVHNCQPFSFAGKRRGTADDRHLWPEMLRLIRALRPHWVLVENVAGMVGMVLDDILADLEAEAYQAQSFLVPAGAVGTPHRRDRVWVVANTERGRLAGGLRPGSESSASLDLADAHGYGECESTGAIPEERRRSRNRGQDVGNANSGRFDWVNGRGPAQEPANGCSDVADTAGREGDCRETGVLAEAAGRGQGEHPTAGLGGQDVADAEGQPIRSGLCPGEPAGEWRGRSTDGRQQELAYPDRQGLENGGPAGCASGEDEGRGEMALPEPERRGGPGRAVESGLGGGPDGPTCWIDEYRWPAPRMREGPSPQYEWEPPRLARGVPDAKKRLTAVGNACVPQEVEVFGRAIYAVEMELREGRAERCAVIPEGLRDRP